MVKNISLLSVKRAMPPHPVFGGVEAVYARFPAGVFLRIDGVAGMPDTLNDRPYDQYVFEVTLDDDSKKQLTYTLEEVVGGINVYCDETIPGMQVVFAFPSNYECPLWYHDHEAKRLNPVVVFKPTEPGVISANLRAKTAEIGEHIAGTELSYFSVKTGKQLHRDLLALPDEEDHYRRYITWFGEEMVIDGYVDRLQGTFRAEAHDLEGNPRKDMGMAFDFVYSVVGGKQRRDKGVEVDLSATAGLPQKVKHYPTPRANKRAHFKQ